MNMDINFRKIFLISLIIALSISALIGIYIFLAGNFGDTESKWHLCKLGKRRIIRNCLDW